MPQVIVLLIGLLIGGVAAVAVFYGIQLRKRLWHITRAVNNFVEIVKSQEQRLDIHGVDIRNIRERVTTMEGQLRRDAQDPLPDRDPQPTVGMNYVHPNLESAVTVWERILNEED